MTEYRGALACLREVVRLAPSSAEARKNLAMIQQLMTEAEAEVRRRP